MSKKLIILCLYLLGALPLFAQEIVTGTVLDEKKAPMPGVRVEVVGRSEYTTTDIDGRFHFDLPVPVKKLQFQYVGKKTIICKVKPEMIVKMKPKLSEPEKDYRQMLNGLMGYPVGPGAFY